ETNHDLNSEANAYRLRHRKAVDQSVDHLSDDNEDSDEKDVKHKYTIGLESKKSKISKPLKNSLNSDYNECKAKIKPKSGVKSRKEYNCDYNDCDYKCRTKTELKIHSKSHKISVQKVRKKYKAKKHYDMASDSYICPHIECQRPYHKYNGLRKHLAAFHSPKRHFCSDDNCRKGFHTMTQLRQHQMIHQNVKPYMCEVNGCTYRCVQKSNLAAHMVTHSSERNFVCPVAECLKRFSSANNLQKHSLVHSNRCTLKCTVDGCNEMFQTDFQRIKHRIKEHNFKPYKWHGVKKRTKVQCEWPGCDYMAVMHQVKLHKLTHTGEKPFACDWPECDKRFALHKSLTDHKNIHYNLKPYTCHWPGCQYRCSNSAMAAKRIANSSIDWTKFSQIVPKSERQMYNAFKAKSDGYLRRMLSYPETAPKIDWSYYRTNITAKGIVDQLESSYKALNIVYPKDNISDQIAAQEAENEKEVELFVKDSKQIQNEAKKLLEKFNVMLPVVDMSEEEFALTFPEWSVRQTREPSWWPHDETTPGLTTAEREALRKPDGPPYSI
ncbi:unnamed protein product, partial [Medioppia subpectinata]